MINKEFLTIYLVLLAIVCAIFSVFAQIARNICGEVFVYLSVYDLSVIGNVPNLQGIVQGTCDDAGDNRVYQTNLVSMDFGKTWETSGQGEELAAGSFQPQRLQVSACVPHDSQTCFRITGSEKIEMSTDAGKSWKVDWAVPPDRWQFMTRDPSYRLAPYPRPDIAPYDLGIVENRADYYVIASQGNQGVLIRSMQGKWERVEVEPAISGSILSISTLGPYPYNTTRILETRPYLRGEINFTLLMAAFFLTLLSIKEWRIIHTRNGANSQGRFWWPYSPYLIAILIFLALGILRIYYMSNLDLYNYFNFHPTLRPILIYSGIIWIIPLVGLVLSWVSILHVSIDRKYSLAALFASFSLPILIIPLTLLPFVLWALGVISNYWLAFGSAAIINIFIAIVGFREPNFVLTSMHKWQKISLHKGASNEL